MTVEDEGHSTHEMVKGLHARFGLLEHRFETLEHRTTGLERDLASDKAHLERHESEAALKGDALLAKMTSLDNRFEKHAEREETDRRWLLGLVLVTMLGSIGSLLMMVIGQ